MSGADLIHEAREFQQKFSPHGWEGSLVGRLAGWEGSLVGRLADALEAAEALAEVRNPPPEYYAETLAEGQEEIARLEADNAALLYWLRSLYDYETLSPAGGARTRDVLTADHPGESFLRELDALRAVAEGVARLRKRVPAGELWSGWERGYFDELYAALAAWEAVRRG